VDGEVAFPAVEVAEVELADGDFQLVLVAGGKHEFAGLFLGVCIAAEKGAEVALEAEGKLVEGDFAAELGGGDEDEEVLLSPLAGGGLPATWQEAFQQLRDHLGSLRGSGKRVVFLDERPWLAGARSRFLPALDHFWNTFASKHPLGVTRSALTRVYATGGRLTQTLRELEEAGFIRCQSAFEKETRH